MDYNIIFLHYYNTSTPPNHIGTLYLKLYWKNPPEFFTVAKSTKAIFLSNWEQSPDFFWPKTIPTPLLLLCVRSGGSSCMILDLKHFYIKLFLSYSIINLLAGFTASLERLMPQSGVGRGYSPPNNTIRIEKGLRPSQLWNFFPVFPVSPVFLPDPAG